MIRGFGTPSPLPAPCPFCLAVWIWTTASLVLRTPILIHGRTQFDELLSFFRKRGISSEHHQPSHTGTPAAQLGSIRQYSTYSKACTTTTVLLSYPYTYGIRTRHWRMRHHLIIGFCFVVKPGACRVHQRLRLSSALRQADDKEGPSGVGPSPCPCRRAAQLDGRGCSSRVSAPRLPVPVPSQPSASERRGVGAFLPGNNRVRTAGLEPSSERCAGSA